MCSLLSVLSLLIVFHSPALDLFKIRYLVTSFDYTYIPLFLVSLSLSGCTYCFSPDIPFVLELIVFICAICVPSASSLCKRPPHYPILCLYHR